MLHWNLSKRKIIPGNQLNAQIQEFVNEYKTQTVFVKQMTNVFAQHIVEVWHNFQAHAYVIVAYEKSELYEDENEYLSV